MKNLRKMCTQINKVKMKLTYSVGGEFMIRKIYDSRKIDMLHAFNKRSLNKSVLRGS